METGRESSWLETAGRWLKRCWQFLKRLRSAYNRRMAQHYSASAVATLATAACAVCALVLLFLPRVIGVADDGSLAPILQSLGLSYRAADAAQPVGAYFVRVYSRGAALSDAGVSTHLLLVRAAMWLDDLFTGDSLFDVRFLAALYVLLYLLAVWLLVRQLALRVRYASEGTVIGMAAVLLFADVAYLAYFNSLYPEPVWMIGLLYCAAACLSLQRPQEKMDPLRFLLLAFAGIALVLCENHCAVIGFVLALFCLKQTAMAEASFPSRTMAWVAAAVLITAGILSLMQCSTRFTQNSQLNAMTSGVLMESTEPAKTLEEFGIDPRFETLADFSCYEDYPYALAGNPELASDFYPYCSTPRLLLYYARHPSSMAALLELGVRSAFSMRRDYCGNYEASAGMPECGQTLLFSLASNFKSRSAPKTIGYLIVLSVAYAVLLNRRNARALPRRQRSVALDTFAAFLALGLMHMMTVILYSGSSELGRYCLPLSVCIDFVTLLVLTEALHRLNLLETEEA